MLVEEVVVLLPPGCQDSGLLVVMTLMVGVVVNWPATPFLQSIRLLLSSLFSSAADPVPSGSKPRLWIHFNDIARSRSVPVSNYILFCFLKPPSINLHTMSIIKSFSDEKNPVWKQGCRSQILPGAGNVKNGRLRQPCIKVIWMLRTGIGTWWVW